MIIDDLKKEYIMTFIFDIFNTDKYLIDNAKKLYLTVTYQKFPDGSGSLKNETFDLVSKIWNYRWINFLWSKVIWRGSNIAFSTFGTRFHPFLSIRSMFGVKKSSKFGFGARTRMGVLIKINLSISQLGYGIRTIILKSPPF